MSEQFEAVEYEGRNYLRAQHPVTGERHAIAFAGSTDRSSAEALMREWMAERSAAHLLTEPKTAS